MIKFILFLALAYLCYRLLLRVSWRGPSRSLGPGASPAPPPIDRSRVVDAEYREVDGESCPAGKGEPGPDDTR